MAIDWDNMMGGEYIQIVAGQPKQMELRDWAEQTQFKDDKTGQVRPGVVFNVTKEDGKEVDKTWTVTAKGALKMLRPIVEKAEAAGNQTINVNVLAVGENKQRQYSINEL
jgi:hypothetical protein